MSNLQTNDYYSIKLIKYNCVYDVSNRQEFLKLFNCVQKKKLLKTDTQKM